MKRTVFIIFASSCLLTLGECFGQESDRRGGGAPRATTSGKKQPVRLSKLFERQPELTPEAKEKATTAVKAVAEDPEAMEAIQTAAKSLMNAASSEGGAPLKAAATQGDSDKILAEGAKLIESALPSAKTGDFDLGKLMPAVASAAPALQDAAAPVLKQVMADNPAPKKAGEKLPAPVRLLPAGAPVPAPVDLLPNRIPRPDVDASTKPTRITAGRAEFDAKTNVVTFEDNVELDHVEFRLTCDILVAELNNADKAAGVEGEKGDAQAAAARVAAGGLRSATATGYVVIEKLTPQGSQVAKSRKTVYDVTTGIVTLSEYPVLDDGKNLVKGKEAWTRILLSPDGKYQVDGPATYDLVTSDNQLPKPGRKP